ncbi:Tim44 domain-containing protein [Shinella zoogloeoides]|uniref:Tim44 domain-containing protein n=1 Tax=Shinella zoogloeoides TaxID=352475 RepID=UPI0028AA37DB|nr:Tim44 domain-containing protein [Shinella zoogloeoides]
MSIQGFGRALAMVAMALMVVMTVVDVAEARRAGGGFGSRGTRTFSTPSTTRTAPTDAMPIDRTMTRQPSAQQPSAGRNSTTANPRPGLFGGFGGSLLGGLMLGGLVGMFLGHGLGGGVGFLGLILQVLLIAGVFMVLRRMFAQRSAPAYSGNAYARGQYSNGGSDFEIPRIGGNRQAAQPKAGDEIGVQQTDLDQFEGLLKELQAAYAAEDFRTLRQITTPEAMSYLAEEIGDNATKGLRNEVRDIHLVQGDVAEAWREGADDYATVAMRYESIDVMRDRSSGRVVSGDPDNLTEAVEVWTFLRRNGGEWKVSAIQGVEAA